MSEREEKKNHIRAIIMAAIVIAVIALIASICVHIDNNKKVNAKLLTPNESPEFEDSLKILEMTYDPISDMYYTKTRDGQVLVTAGPDAEEKMIIEIERRKNE